MRALLLLQQGALKLVYTRVLIYEALVKHSNLLFVLLGCEHEFLPVNSILKLIIQFFALHCEFLQVPLPVFVLSLCFFQRRDPNFLFKIVPFLLLFQLPLALSLHRTLALLRYPPIFLVFAALALILF